MADRLADLDRAHVFHPYTSLAAQRAHGPRVVASAKGVWVLQRFTRRESAGWGSEQGEVLVAEKVVGFKKIKMGTLENVGSGEVELPQQEMQTTSAWLTLDPDLLHRISPRRDDLVDGLRALTHLLHNLAPIFLLCDIRDVGAWLGDGSPAEAGQVVTRETMRAQLVQGDTFTPTIYLYDNQPGGIGQGPDGDQAGLGGIHALAQQAGDRLAGGEIARRQQHDGAFPGDLEEHHLAERADVIDTGVGARVGQEHQAFVDLDSHAIRHRIIPSERWRILT